MPTISVVIPAYNASTYIEGAVESVLAQSRTPDETVVVDDGSQDDTVRRVRAMAGPVRVVAAPHGGPASARNVGARETSGDWIAYLDADDRWDRRKLEVFERVIRAGHRPGLLFSDFRRRDLETGHLSDSTNTDIFDWLLRGAAPDPVPGGPGVRSFAPREAVEALLRGYPIFPSSAMVRRDLLEEVGGWDPSFPRSQDLELWLRLVRVAGMAYLHEVLTTVHVREDHGGSYRWISRQLEWDLRVLRHHARSGSPGHDDRGLVRRYIGERTIWRGDLARRHGRRLDAVRWYLKAARHMRQLPRVVHRTLLTVLGRRG